MRLARLRLAALHAAYDASLALMLCEILLVGYRAIPLTRPYVPGGSRFHMLWALYLSGFITYTYSAARLERDLLFFGTEASLNAAAIFCAWTTELGVVVTATCKPSPAKKPRSIAAKLGRFGAPGNAITRTVFGSVAKTHSLCM